VSAALVLPLAAVWLAAVRRVPAALSGPGSS
jgi:hypothetical protein